MFTNRFRILVAADLLPISYIMLNIDSSSNIKSFVITLWRFIYAVFRL